MARKKTTTRKTASKKTSKVTTKKTNKVEDAVAPETKESDAPEEVKDAVAPPDESVVETEKEAEGETTKTPGEIVVEAMREDLGDKRSVSEIINEDEDPFPALMNCSDEAVAKLANRLVVTKSRIEDRRADARIRIADVRNLYNEIIRIMNVSTNFKSEFMVLFAFLKINMDGIFESSRVFELVHFWTNDPVGRFTYTLFITAMRNIITASDIKKGLSRVDPDVLFDKNTTGFNDNAKKNFVAFFKL